MLEALLAGYKETELEDKRVKEHYERLGFKVKTYNKKSGFADHTDIYEAAHGVKVVVYMAKDDPDNADFYRLCAKVAGENKAELHKRPKLK